MGDAGRVETLAGVAHGAMMIHPEVIDAVFSELASRLETRAGDLASTPLGTDSPDAPAEDSGLRPRPTTLACLPKERNPVRASPAEQLAALTPGSPEAADLMARLIGDGLLEPEAGFALLRGETAQEGASLLRTRPDSHSSR